MKSTDNISIQLKNKGYRFSAVRNFILASLNKSSKPLSAYDLQKLIDREKMPVNKTTLYRELNFLKKEKIILEMRLGDIKRCYEPADRNHHHHIICIKCNKVEDFVGCNSKKLINEALKQATDFAEITNHTFDFFGLCKMCAKK